jgi:ubiquinone/menaquinone biosynthesis C-methylase UbiE
MPGYLMEDDQESLRLDVKTDGTAVESQARWAGIQPGMKVADLGCGSGKTTYHLHKMVQPSGTAIGIDIAADRVRFARQHYGTEGISFAQRDIRAPLDDLGCFDFLWIRFVLEYHRQGSFDIVKNISRILKPGGTLCLIDLDYNCLGHWGLNARMQRAVRGIMDALEQHADFDPFVGRKLYAFLYDLGYEAIDVMQQPHHLIFGKLRESDAFNWCRKVEVAAKHAGYPFPEYPGGWAEFAEEFRHFFSNPRRFTFTPLIACRGTKPGPGPESSRKN